MAAIRFSWLTRSAVAILSIIVVAGCSTGRADHYDVHDRVLLSGTRYSGTMMDVSMADGYGSGQHPDGSRYEGSCKNGLFEGQGKYTFADGAVYEGEHVRGYRNGQGKYTSPAGDDYAGEFRNDSLLRGQGTMIQAGGSRYTGTWDRETGRGSGEIVWKDGRHYKGQWIILSNAPDQPDGDGVMEWPNGTRVSGEFRNGQPHGWGTVTYANGTSEEGLWRCGKLVRRVD